MVGFDYEQTDTSTHFIAITMKWVNQKQEIKKIYNINDKYHILEFIKDVAFQYFVFCS